MKTIETAIPGVLVLEPKVFSDARGFFLETYNERLFRELGISERFVQDNQSHSKRGVLRGMHYQVGQPQGKLIRVLHGEIFDVVVDLRRQSPTFGKWVADSLSSENKRMLWVPKEFAHGFYALSDSADVSYKVTEFYAPQSERTLAWNDANVGIDWPFEGEPILSEKDRAGHRLAEYTG